MLLMLIFIFGCRLFEQSGKCLNLEALLHLLNALVCASQTRVFYSISTGKLDQWVLLQRITDLILRLSRSSRPLIHQMKIWSAVSSHFVEVNNL